jgi:hypothetical protein
MVDQQRAMPLLFIERAKATRSTDRFAVWLDIMDGARGEELDGK